MAMDQEGCTDICLKLRFDAITIIFQDARGSKENKRHSAAIFPIALALPSSYTTHLDRACSSQWKYHSFLMNQPNLDLIVDASEFVHTYRYQ
mgnify:CR=1 FL=1